MQSRIEILSHLVRNARKEQGLTQEQLAVASGVGVRFIRDLERGKESCQIGKILHVLAMLGLDIQIDDKKL
ncbi:type II toxin-antitoxin system Y4mF family antitoxin [Bartonella sp. A5(2022)]|nr:type II toxin-antitoxin system Y4mF family antitoxin [Bartonella sp. A05]MCZ2203684.1 type II toxin-antitoxin system Y4mF family antitoxin [Bartonella sp. A05]